MQTEPQSDHTRRPHPDSCPRGPSECPIFEEVEQLRTECDRLRDLSLIDPLTGLHNFGFLMGALAREMERTCRTGLPTAVIMVDLDRFKQINDTHGHQAGNEALRAVADILRAGIRKIDIACRYGGEEFALILPGTRRSRGVLVAERLRAAIEGARVEFHGRALRLTASFGVDGYSGDERLGAEGLLERADALLLEAKEMGRNQVRSRAAPAAGVSGEERAALDFL